MVKLTDEQREIARLKKELRNSQMEAEILKKAIGIFSTSDKRKYPFEKQKVLQFQIWVHEATQIKISCRDDVKNT